MEGNKHMKIKDLIEYSKGGILSKGIFKDSNTNVTLFCMAAGTEISEHTSSKKGFLHVIEGKGDFDLEGEKIEMSPSTFITMEKGAKHSLKVEENTSFLLFLTN